MYLGEGMEGIEGMVMSIQKNHEIQTWRRREREKRPVVKHRLAYIPMQWGC
jgi:hypothetical protein